MSKSLGERFWAKVNKNGPTQPHMDTPCWEWTGALTGGRYGVIWHENKNALAHRMSHFFATGETPPMVCHRCDNKRCVNPEHLYSGDENTNGADAAERAPLRRGTDNVQAKLDPEKVREIRKRLAEGETYSSVARGFGVSHVNISNIAKGRIWSHVK